MESPIISVVGEKSGQGRDGCRFQFSGGVLGLEGDKTFPVVLEWVKISGLGDTQER